MSWYSVYKALMSDRSQHGAGNAGAIGRALRFEKNKPQVLMEALNHIGEAEYNSLSHGMKLRACYWSGWVKKQGYKAVDFRT